MWDVTLHIEIAGSRRFEGPKRLHLQGRGILRSNVPMKFLDMPTPLHCVTSQKTRIVNIDAVETRDLAISQLFTLETNTLEYV
jgi:hypothetical protein